MVFVNSYGGYLPKSEHIPTDTVRSSGVSGITHDGEIYCVDCAIDMELVKYQDGKLFAVVDEKLVQFNKAPWTGVVLPTHETQTQLHCGKHSECVNSLQGWEHPYNHEEKIGIGIKESTIKH